MPKSSTQNLRPWCLCYYCSCNSRLLLVLKKKHKTIELRVVAKNKYWPRSCCWNLVFQQHWKILVYYSKRILNCATMIVLGKKNKCKHSWIKLMHYKTKKGRQYRCIQKKKLMLLLLQQKKAQGCSSWRNVGNGKRTNMLKWTNYNCVKSTQLTCIHIRSSSIIMFSP